MPAKVSVIVPVHNAERTLPACLGNLVHQSLPEIELILVNDASTDQSLPILLDCERAFPEKVLLVNLEQNLGPGGARNAGLSYASGEYIGFVDSDDLVDLSMYEALYRLAREKNCDMVDCAYYYEEKDTLILQTADNCRGILNIKKQCELIAGGGYLWSRLFRRSLFEGLSFREHVILEDMEILMLLFMRTKRLETTKNVFYKYCFSPTSASQLSDPARYQAAITEAMKAVNNALTPLPDYDGVRAAVEYSILHLYQCGIVNALSPRSHLSESTRDSYLRELYALRHSFAGLPPQKNPYFARKFNASERKLILDIDLKYH